MIEKDIIEAKYFPAKLCQISAAKSTKFTDWNIHEKKYLSMCTYVPYSNILNYFPCLTSFQRLLAK